MTAFRFTGRERVTIELAGVFDPAAVPLPAGLIHDGGRLSLFAFHVEGLRARGVPLLAWTYPEVLWRIAVTRAGVPSWWAIACDLEPRGPRWAARRYVRYAVRANRVVVEPTRIASSGPAGALEIAVAEVGSPSDAPVEDRQLRTGADAGWEVPWGDQPGPRQAHDVEIAADSLSAPTLGTPVEWAARAVVRRGRIHRCGVAHR